MSGSAIFRRRIFSGVGALFWETGAVDAAIVIAEVRARRGIYTPKGVRGVYTYTGPHSKTIVFGVITTDGRGLRGIRALPRWSS